MKKEENYRIMLNKGRSVYKYELQATNQILQDAFEIYPLSVPSTTGTNRHKNDLLQQSDQQLYEQESLIDQSFPFVRQIKVQNESAIKIFQENDDMKMIDKSFGNSCFSKLVLKKQVPCKKRMNKIKRQQDQYNQIKIDQQIYQLSRDILIQSKKSSIDKSIENFSRRDWQLQNRKQMRKQRRGLANISLKVKNIVANRGKMSFKEVSDQVLKQTQQDLPLQHQQCEKQIKNIRRRVYDALNVLVSVGILGKQQRCVVHTAFTNIPGKKLSSHWNIITQKNRTLQQNQLNFNHKYQNLLNLKKQYQYMMYLRQRNKKYRLSQEDQSQYEINQLKQQKTMIKNMYKQFHFPLVVILPPKVQFNNMTVNIEFQQRSNQYIRKYQIKGNQYILTDVDLLKHLKLQNNFEIEQIEKIKDHIQQIQNAQIALNQQSSAIDKRQDFKIEVSKQQGRRQQWGILVNKQQTRRQSQRIIKYKEELRMMHRSQQIMMIKQLRIVTRGQPFQNIQDIYLQN